MTLNQARATLNAIFAQYERRTHSAAAPVGKSFGVAKIYEAWVLAHVLERLKNIELLAVELVGGSTLALKASRGPVNRNYPFFRAYDTSRDFEVFTDVEFRTMSAALRTSAKVSRGDFHELDILVTEAGVPDGVRPRFDQVLIAVECKHTTYHKRMLREALGVRRELSLLVGSSPTSFSSWPRAYVPANPASCLLVYTTDSDVGSLQDPEDMFGLDLNYLPAP